MSYKPNSAMARYLSRLAATEREARQLATRREVALVERGLIVNREHGACSILVRPAPAWLRERSAA